jgi:hypothetical protein
VIAANTWGVVGCLVVVWVNARGSTDAAMWALVAVSLPNLTVIGALLGLGTGVFLYLFTISASAVVLGRPREWKSQAAIGLAALVAVVAIVLAAPATPESIAGPLEKLLLVLSVTGTLLFVTIVLLYFRLVVERAEDELRIANERSERLLLDILPDRRAVEGG